MEETLTKLTTPNIYDNGITYKYKQAIKLGVPEKYVLIESNIDIEENEDFFDLEQHENLKFTTIFNIIADQIKNNKDIKLTELWDFASKIKGDKFNPSQFVFIWLHSIFQNELTQYYRDANRLFSFVKNYYKYINEPLQFLTLDDLYNSYLNWWLPLFQEEFNRDYLTLENFVKAQNEIITIPQTEHSEFTIESMTLIYEYPVDYDILPDLFNAAKTSYIVPFIQYNIRSLKEQPENIPRYYKIYKGRSEDEKPNYNNVIISNISEANKANTIYLNIWTGENLETKEETEDEARNDKKESFELVSISYLTLEKNVIRVSAKTAWTNKINESLILKRLYEHVPNLKKATEKELMKTKISGECIFYNIEVYDFILYHLITNDLLFSTYLYIDESQKAFPLKKRLNVQYRSNITSNNASEKIKSAVHSTVIKDFIYKEGKYISIVRLKVKKGISFDITKRFIDIFSRLLTRHEQEKDNISNLYYYYAPEYWTIPLEEPEKEKEKEMSSLKLLRKLAPDIFVENYARDCQKSYQPKIIKEDEIDYWKTKYIIKNGIAEERQVYQFPKDNPKIYFVCPSDEYPYPKLVVNNRANKKIYKYVPCCSDKNQLFVENSYLLIYYFGEKQKIRRETKINLNVPIKGNSVLKHYKIGLIPVAISNFLKKYCPSFENCDAIYRLGVELSPNSFIHCVLEALNVQEYMGAEDKEEFVNTFKQNIFKYKDKYGNPILPELVKQELYDMSNDEIVHLATDPTQFFDPLLFYRLMEEIFDCTIYIFNMSGKKHKVDTDTSLLMSPRYKNFHVHLPIAGRPVILIVRNYGGEANALDYPQSELIIGKIGNGVIKSYGDSDNIVLYPIITFVSRTLTWQITDRKKEPHGKEPQITCRMNMYSSINYQTLFGKIHIDGQVLDSSGKARMFVLFPELNENGTFSNLKIFVNVPPTAPLNVKTYDIETLYDFLPPYNKVIELFGNPISITLSVDENYVTGLWFPIGDIKFGFYCQCIEYPLKEFKKLYPNINVFSELSALTLVIPKKEENKLTPISRIRYLRRAANIIEQIVKYLYVVDGRPDILNFLINICVLSSGTGDSIEIYDISTIPRVLPEGKTSREILTQLSKISPKIFPNGKLLLYNEQMYHGLFYQLEKFNKITIDLNIKPEQLRAIQNYYITKEDYNFNKKTEIILGSFFEFRNWTDLYLTTKNVLQVMEQKLRSNVQIRLNNDTYKYQEPYIYQKSNNIGIGSNYNPKLDNFYLIQNVAGGSILRAINVAYVWLKEKKNLGYLAPEYPDSYLLPVHKIYVIDSNQSIILHVDNTNGEKTYLELILYNNKYYGAMLPIL